MLIINNKTKTLILNRNLKYKAKRGMAIDFEFTNPLYNELYDIERAYIVDDIIYVIGKLNKVYSNIFPQVGDKIEYTYSKGHYEDYIYD